MKKLTNELLEAYLDGELSSAQKANIESMLTQDAEGRAELDRLIHQQSLCRAAMTGYAPSPMEAAALARRAMELCYEMEFAPVGKIQRDSDISILRWIKRASVAAACLVIGAGCFLAGRGSIASPAVRYAVEIQTPGGETVSQTFSSYEQAQRFYRSYQLSKQSQSTNGGNVRETMAMATQGVF